MGLVEGIFFKVEEIMACLCAGGSDMKKVSSSIKRVT